VISARRCRTWQAWQNAFWEHIGCAACLRLRYSPIHGASRLLGFCPGDKR
jgi:hypothetical protein